MAFEFKKTPHISLSCKLFPVQYWEYEYRPHRDVHIVEVCIKGGLTIHVATNPVQVPQSVLGCPCLMKEF